MVMLGGGQNALADDEYPYFPTLLSLVRDFEAADKAVLGICLGSQLLARAFGGQNRVGVATEFGWQAISLTEQAKGDPVLGALPQRFPIFQWHDDTFSLPQQAVRLASARWPRTRPSGSAAPPTASSSTLRGRPAAGAGMELSFASMIGARHPDWGDRLEGEAGPPWRAGRRRGPRHRARLGGDHLKHVSRKWEPFRDKDMRKIRNLKRAERI